MADFQEVGSFENLSLERRGCIFMITMKLGAENRLTAKFCQELIRAFNTGLDLDEAEQNPHATTEGFYPLLHTILDFPFPTIALLTGHTFGGGCPVAFAHDYRVMNSQRGFISMPPVDLGMYFPGVGVLPRLKLRPQIARKVLLEGHRFTGEEALRDGLVDFIAQPDDMLAVAFELAAKWAPKAKAGPQQSNYLSTSTVADIILVQRSKMTAPLANKVFAVTGAASCMGLAPT
ncbi:ClpP/crotonase-like domain-containing protein [Aspergillus novoparasiticus]|uniref:ClpP/crotonase-like domain-containing protein n=1 Tax=Aspergillus novoparasiticus TaxID=986946 RepID=A0A5N6F069_9EURO|nr:ClpP/crotonase-like domain-containing protein [Aspergillus novoparasiticus]